MLMRSIKTLFAVTALVATLPIVDSLAQQPAPGTQAPAPAQGGGGGGGRGGGDAAAARGGGAAAPADYNISLRSDADKALLNRYALNQAWYTMPAGRFPVNESLLPKLKRQREICVSSCGRWGPM